MSRLSPLLQPRHAVLRWVLLGLVILAGAGAWSRYDYHDTLEHAAIQQANVAQLLETHTSHVIANADSVLDRVLDDVRDHDIMGAGGDQRWPGFADMAKKLPTSGRLWLYRADGSAVMASHMRHSTNNASDREYFTAQKKPGVGLFIGETVVGKTTGKKVFNLSRRLDAPDGSFAGVAMVAIDIDVFIQVVSGLNLGKSAAYTLIRGDGAVIMRHPDAGATGKRYGFKVLDEMTKQAAGLFTTVSAVDGVARQVVYRRHATLPLAIVVSISRDEILSPWRQRVLVLGSGLVVLFLVTALLLRVAMRAAQRERRVAARMQTVLDTVAEGICGLDVRGRIVFINPAGARLLGFSPDELVGKDLHQTAHHSLPDGTPYPAADCPILKLLGSGGEEFGTLHLWRKDGHGFAAEYAATRVEDLDGQRGVVLAFRDVSAVIAARTALREQKEFVTSILDSLTEHVAVIDADGMITAVNAAWLQFAAANDATAEAQVAVGANYLDSCTLATGTPSGAEAPAALAGIQGVLAGQLSEFTLEYPCHSATEHRWFVLHVLPLRGTRTGAVIIHQNVSERHQAEAQLRANEEYFRMLAENMVDIVWKADKDMRFTYVNDADRRLRGFERDEVVGQSIMATVTAEGQDILAAVMDQRRLLEAANRNGEALRFEIPQCSKHGAVVWTEVVSLPIYDTLGQISGYQGIGRDVSARRREDARRVEQQRQLEVQLEEAAAQRVDLQELANRDPLTGVNNRRHLDETLPRELSRAQREGYPVAVIMLDLDHFKKINDTYGHAAGDEVLRAVAALLKQGARASDLICRYGGEEFAVIMPGTTAAHAGQRIETWRSELAEIRVRYGAQEIRVTLSAGVAGFPAHGDTMETLLARADEMLYRAKSEGRNRVIVCSDSGG